MGSGEAKFKLCCKVVAFSLDFWACASIDLNTFKNCGSFQKLSDQKWSADFVESLGVFLGQFYNRLIGFDGDDLETCAKEISAAVSTKVSKKFSVDHSLLPKPFRDFLSTTFPQFWEYVDEEVHSEGQPVQEVTSPITLKGAQESILGAHPPLQLPNPHAKTPDSQPEASDSESENEGADFDPEVPTTVASQTPHPFFGSQSQPIVLQSLIPVITEQVKESPVSVDLVTYEQLVEKIPPLLVSGWSSKFFPVETFVDFVDHPQYQLFKNCVLLRKEPFPTETELAVSLKCVWQFAVCLMLRSTFLLFCFVLCTQGCEHIHA